MQSLLHDQACCHARVPTGCTRIQATVVEGMPALHESQHGGAPRELEGLTELRGKVVQLFVKHLSGSNETAIGLAHAGLVAIMQHQRMIKAVLQARARPVKHTLPGSRLRPMCKLCKVTRSALTCVLQVLTDGAFDEHVNAACPHRDDDTV